MIAPIIVRPRLLIAGSRGGGPGFNFSQAGLILHGTSSWLMKHTCGILAAAVLFYGSVASADVRLEILAFSSRVLQNNPLQDPVVRRVAVFVPDHITKNAGLPVVY